MSAPDCLLLVKDCVRVLRLARAEEIGLFSEPRSKNTLSVSQHLKREADEMARKWSTNIGLGASGKCSNFNRKHTN